MKCDTCDHLHKEDDSCDLGYELGYQENMMNHTHKNYRPVRTPEPERKDLMNIAYCENHTQLAR